MSTLIIKNTKDGPSRQKETQSLMRVGKAKDRQLVQQIRTKQGEYEK